MRIERFTQAPLAIVGAGACLPGAASLEEVWALLLAGRCTIGPLPPSRLDRELYYDPNPGVPGKTYAAIGGVIEDGSLDRASLGLDGEEAAQADAAHLWLLRAVLDALAHAGIVADELAGSRTAVLVGHARGSSLLSDLAWAAGIQALLARLGDAPALAALSRHERDALLRALVDGTRARYPGVEAAATPMMQANAAARLVTRRLGTTGPYMVVDAACASSFAALDLAARSLHAGEIDAAIVGGCSFSQWSSLVMFSQARALSATGSFPFDARGDGFVSSDGYAAVVVMPLAAARRDGRRVLAVIRGIGASCDGRGKALWAPQRRGQVAAMRRAYGPALDPATVQVVEAHATGTQVGDDTEIHALAEVLGAGRGAGGRVPIGSVKGNVGHTREAAGLTSLVKMLLALERGIVPPTAGFDPATPTRRVEWDSVPLRVVAEPEPWPDRPGLPRRCAIDCFGIGGLNFHVVLDGPAAPDRRGPVAARAPATMRVRVVERTPIAVVGAGVVLPGAHSLDALARALDGPAPFGPPPRERWDAALFHDPEGGPYRLRSVTGAFLSDWRPDWRRHRIPPRQLERTDPLQLMLVEAAAQALAGRGAGALAEGERARTGVFVGSIFGSDHMADLNTALRIPELLRDLAAHLAVLGRHGDAAGALLAEAEAALRERFPVHDEAGSFSSSTLASRIARHFDLNGPCMALDAEEASGLAGLAAATQALAAGDCDLAFCCAGQRTMHFGRFMYYDRIGWLRGAETHGLVPAEGAAALLLRRAADAEASGERVLAVIDDVRGAAASGAPWEALSRAVRTAAGGLAGEARPALIECFSGDAATIAEDERRALGDLAERAALRSATVRVGMTQGATGIVGVVDAIVRAGRGEAGPPPCRVAVNAVGLQGLGFHARLRVPAPARPKLPARAATARPRVALVFSGQGSQYAGMLRELVSWCEPARAAMAECDAAFAAAGEPSFAELCWHPASAARLGSDTRTTQLAVLAADLIVHRVLASWGVGPDVVLGHSFGEYPALVAAGSWDLPEALAAVQGRSRALEALGAAPGRLIATTAAGERLERALAPLGGDGVFVASVNSPEQTVVGAAGGRVEEVLAAFAAAGETATVVPAPQPFHTPLLAPARPALRDALAAAPLRPPRTPFLSSVDTRYVADPDDLRERLVRQLTEPFSFVAVVRRAFADGVRVFVEVGPRGVATRFIRAILAGEAVTAIACDEPRADSREHLARVRAQLEALGLLAGTAGAGPATAPRPDAGPCSYAATRRPLAPAAAPIVHVDATAARRGGAVVASPQASSPPPAAGEPPRSEAERLVVALASEHTGFPPETIHLDFDLEADLGIDSIAKAQLLGRLTDRFALALPGGASGALDLASIATLRDVVRAIDGARRTPPGVDVSDPRQGRDEPSCRWVLRTAECARVGRTAPRPLPTLVMGAGALADAIIAALRRAGSDATLVCNGEARRMVLVGGRGGGGDGAVVRSAASAILAAQRWVAALDEGGGVEGAELVAVTAMGGGLAFSGAGSFEPGGGALAGLVKALARELPGLRGRVIDVAADAAPAAVARAVVRELAEESDPLEIGLVGDRRFTVVAIEQPLAAGAPARWEALTPEAAWIVTGGASGITARCALALGSRFGMHLHLIGSMALDTVPETWLGLDAGGREALRVEVTAKARENEEPPATAWRRVERQIERRRTLAELTRAGVRHTYHCADVRDRRSLAGALRTVRAQGAPILGVVHGAGFEAARAITSKRAAAVRQTLGVKVGGMVNLLALTAGDPLAAVVGFGSVSGRWGGRGQADYSAANELLAKLLAAHRRHTGVRCTTFHWPPWDETGMATRPETRIALEQAGWRLLPVAEGVAHFLREIEAGLPESEVLIADRTVVVGRRAERVLPQAIAIASEGAESRGALVESTRSVNGNGHRRAVVLLDPTDDPFLRDHRLDDRPLLPAVISLEALAEVAVGARRTRAIAFLGASFHLPLVFPEPRPRRVEVLAEPRDGGVRAELRGEPTRSGDGPETAPIYASSHIRAETAVGEALHRPPPARLPWRSVDYDAAAGNGLRIRHGPSLRSLNRLAVDGDAGWGELVAPSASALCGRRGRRSWLLPAALLDGCLVACGLYARQRLGVIGLPAGFGELRVLGVPRAGTRCTVAFALRERDGRHLKFDFTLATAAGSLVASAIGYRTVVLGERTAPR